MHNDVVKSDIHSVDTYGFSEVIFGLTHLLGFSFAPIIKNFKDQQLYGCNTPKFYHELDYKLLPKRKINRLLQYSMTQYCLKVYESIFVALAQLLVYLFLKMYFVQLYMQEL